jgi:hypothetical protein
VDEHTRRYWLSTYRRWGREARDGLRRIEESNLVDPLTNHQRRRLTQLIGIYEAAIQELVKGLSSQANT